MVKNNSGGSSLNTIKATVKQSITRLNLKNNLTIQPLKKLDWTDKTGVVKLQQFQERNYRLKHIKYIL